MADTVTVDKVYFETLLRRYVQLSPYRQPWANQWYRRAELVGHLSASLIGCSKEAYSSL